jgi:putative ABC transport system ATP-binding protein
MSSTVQVLYNVQTVNIQAVNSQTVPGNREPGKAGSIDEDSRNCDSMIVIEARGLHHVYGSGDVRVEALRGVDLAVEQGEVVAVMGASGSGKSTLLHMLGAIEVPTSGTVMLEGRDLAQLNDDERTILRRRRLGFVFQKINLLPMLSAAENVALPLVLDGVAAREADDRAAGALKLVGMAHRAGHIPSQMSGGEQQRVAIARALVTEPALLLADEPTGSLDSANGQHVIALLRELADHRHQTLVVVTHDPAVAAHADRQIYFRDGRIEREESLTGGSAASGISSQGPRIEGSRS